MKKVIKIITAVCMALAVMLPGVTVMAGTLTPEQIMIEDLRNEINNLDRQIDQLNRENDSLRNQLQDANSRPESTPRPSAPRVKMLSPQTVTLNRGETLDVDITIKNIGTSVASNVLSQVSPGGESPFTAEFVGNSNNVGGVGENATKTMTLRITADPDAEPGTYPVELTHSYRNRDASNLSETDTLYVRIGGKAVSPNIMLREFKTDKPSLKPGDRFNLTATLENVGGGNAQEVQIAIETDPDHLYLTGDMGSTYFSEIASEYKGQARFPFALTTRARAGAYPVTFKLTYRDESGNPQENTYTYYVNVTSEGAENRPNIEIRSLSAPSGQINVDQNANISMEIYNNGGVPANNVRVTAIPSDEEAIVPKSANIQQIGTLAANAAQAVSFTFAPTANAQNRSYNVGFLVEYETGSDLADGTPEVFSFEQYASLNVNNPDGPDGSKGNKPKMIISEYSVEPQIVRAGREFDLSLTFQNASSVKSVNNIKITLSAVEYTERKGAVFTPVGGSNTFFIDEIPPKGEVERTLRMFTVPDADPRTYNIVVEFKYQDDDFNEYDESEQISINVKQVTRIEISEPFIPDTVQMGQGLYLDFSVINSGRVSLSNLRVRVDGDFDTSEANMYIGNLGKGNTANYSGMITPLMTGSQSGTIVVYGEDDTGELIEFTQPFSVSVMEMSMEGMEGMEGMPMEDGMRPDMGGMEGMGANPEGELSTGGKVLDFIKKPYFWGPLAGLIAAGATTAVILIRRKRKRIDFDE